MSKKYAACYANEWDIQTFNSIEEAKAWLSERHAEDVKEYGYTEESCNGDDWIAKITHRSKYVEEEEYAYISEDGDEWPHSNEFGVIGIIVIEEVKE